MKYVALLRGVNVGGNGKVPMVQLKQVFEQTGMERVSTYINSGNVIFVSQLSIDQLVPMLEAALQTAFGFYIKVLVRSHRSMQAIIKAIPSDWANNAIMKCDVMFLDGSVDNANIVRQLTPNLTVDHLLYVPGAMLWSVDPTTPHQQWYHLYCWYKTV